MEEVATLRKHAKMVFVGLWLVWGIAGGLKVEYFWFLNGVDLAFHEFGHLAFRFLGEFVQFLGGTIMQLLIPGAIAAYFLRRRQYYASAVAVFWIGQNLFNIAVYVRDARAQALPLVGGGIHDWGYILGRLGLLQQDQTIGAALSLAGWGAFAVSAYVGFRYAGQETEDLDSSWEDWS